MAEIHFEVGPLVYLKAGTGLEESGFKANNFGFRFKNQNLCDSKI